MQNLSLFILLRMEMGVLEGCGIAYYLENQTKKQTAML